VKPQESDAKEHQPLPQQIPVAQVMKLVAQCQLHDRFLSRLEQHRRKNDRRAIRAMGRQRRDLFFGDEHGRHKRDAHFLAKSRKAVQGFGFGRSQTAQRMAKAICRESLPSKQEEDSARVDGEKHPRQEA